MLAIREREGSQAIEEWMGVEAAQQPNKFFSIFSSVLHPARENVIKNLGFKCWIISSLKCSVFCTLKRNGGVYILRVIPKNMRNWKVERAGSCSTRWPASTTLAPLFEFHRKICINVTELRVILCFIASNACQPYTKLHEAWQTLASFHHRLNTKKINSGSLKFKIFSTWIISFSESFRRPPFRRKMSFLGTLIRVPPVSTRNWLCSLPNVATSQMFLRRQF